MHPWPNHDGSPTAPDDDFPPPPPQIGEVLSATTNSRAGKVKSDGLGVLLGFTAGGAFLGWLVGWALTQAAGEELAVPLQAGVPAVLGAVTFFGFKRLDKMLHVTFVGRRGLAVASGLPSAVKWKVFEFATADKLELTVTHQTVNGMPTGDVLKLKWVDASGKELHEQSGMVPYAGQTITLPPGAPKYFLDAVMQAWDQHQQERTQLGNEQLRRA